MPDYYNPENRNKNSSRSGNKNNSRSGINKRSSDRSDYASDYRSGRGTPRSGRDYVVRRRKARRNRSIARLLASLVMLLVVVAGGMFIWSKRDNIISSMSAFTGFFAAESGDKTPDGSDDPGNNTSHSTEDSDAEPDETVAPTPVPSYGADGYDFNLTPLVGPYVGDERAIVFIDPGHGGIDGGAPGYLGDGTRIAESGVVLDIAEKLQTELAQMNIETYMMREDDTFISLYARVARASMLALDYMSAHQPELVDDRDYIADMKEKLMVPVEINSDNPSSGGFGFMKGYGMSSEQMKLVDLQQNCLNVIFVSIHCNGHDFNESLRGMQVFYCDDTVVEEDEAQGLAEQTEPVGNNVYRNRDNERNKKLAQHIYDRTVGQVPSLGATNAGAPVLGGNYAVLREHGLAGALIEVAYMTNSSDLQLLLDSANQQKIAAGIASGIDEYFSELFNS
ncbi:MAG: N-acetylmuramoyl-L-alanine amidase [Eubacteriales bacterium]|nr:N-acetylmuramoyl-L-alanine amidase [Eubacteriales bacterium]MDD4682734.1 N-acetylmuramoyl-L-alanine amidase [Eubacteriales bacterium]